MKRTREDRIIIGRHIKRHRTEAGLSGAELARKAGVPQPTISNLENYRIGATLPTLRKIADALGVSLRDLLPEE